MKALKWIAIVLGAYVGIVVAFESLIGVIQPGDETTLVITTTDGDGGKHDRVLSRLESDGQVYVAANHWPRAWYNRALENPEVEIEQEGETTARRAVPVMGEEHDRVNRDNALGPGLRFLTGFPPRAFLRLDPQ